MPGVLVVVLGLWNGGLAADVETGNPLADWSPLRAWKAVDGREMNAEILGVSNEEVSFLMASGKTATVGLANLAEEDRAYALEWAKLATFFNLGYKAVSNIENTAQAGLFDGAFAKEGKVHESRHFHFSCDESLSGLVVKDFSKLFEATYSALEMHPLAITVAKPDDKKFPVRLFGRRSSYIEAGGPENSAGVFKLKEREILVPLESLGLTLGPRGYRKTAEYDPSTLIHETTHALMDHWLDHLPMWFIEGFAEYIAAVPYRDGVLDFSSIDRGVRENIIRRFGGNINRFVPVEPDYLVALGKGAYMGQPEWDPPPIELPTVRPMAIELRATSEAGEASKQEVREGPKSGLKQVSENVGMRVSQHYASSMLLVHQLMKDGQVDALREFMMTSLRLSQDREEYLTEFTNAYRSYEAEYNARVSAYNESVRKYQDGKDAYLSAMSRRSAGETVSIPERPEDPVVPELLKVPEILAQPRGPEELSLLRIWEKANARLQIPARLEIPR